MTPGHNDAQERMTPAFNVEAVACTVMPQTREDHVHCYVSQAEPYLSVDTLSFLVFMGSGPVFKCVTPDAQINRWDLTSLDRCAGHIALSATYAGPCCLPCGVQIRFHLPTAQLRDTNIAVPCSTRCAAS